MPIALYPEIVTNQDLSPDHGFGTEIDDACEAIHDATKGWGANRQKVIDALATQDATTRTKISIRYKELYGKELKDVMKKEFSGDFGNTLQLLALPPDKAEACMIHKACKGIGASANVVWSVLCGRTNSEIDMLKKTFFNMYNKDLGSLLMSELHGDMERLAFNCLQGAEEVYDPQFHNAERAIEDAQTIHDKGQGRWGTEGRGIFKVLCAAPREHLENINRVYAEKYGFTLQKAMEKEMSGNVREATVHLIRMKLKPYEAMAELVKSACAGVGTDELLLTCCIIRYQGILAHVQSTHIELFGKTIHDRVRSEVGGKLQTVLLQILNTAWPEQGI